MTLKLRLIGSVLLAAYAAILVWNSSRLGITMDEPTRLLGAQLYWMNLPDHPPQDQPPLLSLVTGWAPRLLHIPLHRDHPVWQTQWKDHVYSYILDQLPGETIGRLFFLARLGVVPFSLLTALLIWHWARRLFAPATALLVLIAFLLLPEARAHGALVTSDMMAAFTYLLAGYCCWQYWTRPSLRTAIRLGLASGLALIAKFSLVIVPLLATLVVLACAIRHRNSARASLAALLLVPLLSWLVLLGAYKFDTRRMRPGEVEDMFRRGEYPGWLAVPARLLTVVPTPREWQAALRLMGQYYRDGSATFFCGKIYSHGHWAYYPACLLWKWPIGFQVLVLAGLLVVAGTMLRRRAEPGQWFLLGPPLIYLAFAMRSPIQLGIRLILPTIVYCVLLAGFGIHWLAQRRLGRVVLTGSFAAILISTGRVFPHDMSYFNEWVGGPERGWRYLSDSNIDWGHLWPELAKYIRRHGLSQVKTFPFGYDKLHRYFRPGELQLEPSPWTPDKLRGAVYEPQPGTYAISASLLGGQYYPRPYRQFLKYFWAREPDDRVGYGMLIYRVP